MRTRYALIFIANFAVFTSAIGQISSANPASTALKCPAIKDLVNTDLFGAWSLLIEGAGRSQVTRLQMLRNPEFAESLAGSFTLDEKKFEVFGDIEDGAFELEETDNGKDISAIWKGRVVEGSCGQTILGTRRETANNSEQNFVLRRPGW